MAGKGMTKRETGGERTRKKERECESHEREGGSK